MAGVGGGGGLTPPEFFSAADGTRLSYRQLGEGRPLLLLHGFFSSGTANWIGNGHARLLADRGHRLVIPDLRAHGRSAAPTDAAAYPADVLVADTTALLDRLGIDDLDAAGYSLGARTVVRMLVRGAPIRRAVIAGQGLDALAQPAGRGRTSIVRRVLDGDDGPHDPTTEWFGQQWGRKSPDARQALRHVLASSVGTPIEQIRAIPVPTLTIMGDADDPVDGVALADALADGSYREVTGDHVAAAANPDLATAIGDYLDDGLY